MSRIIAAVGLATAMLAGTSVASYATPTTPTVVNLAFSGLTPTNEASIKVGTKTYNFDLFAFTPPLKGSTTLNGQVGTSTPGLTFNAFDFFTKSGNTYSVFGDPGTVGTYKVTLPSGTSTYGFGALDFTKFEANTVYYVGVSAAGGAGKSYAGTLSVPSVPLPNSVALFGTAIAGLGVLGAVRRKKSASATV